MTAKTSAKPASKSAKPPRAAGRPRSEDVQVRAHELLVAAGRLFIKNGYSKVSLEMIAREARVAIRTIYVKFGGKTGLVKALMQAKREDFLASRTLGEDPRPVAQALRDFAHELHALLNTPEAQALQRMVAAEAQTEPELAETFYAHGPGITHATLQHYFERPDVRAQLREDLPFEQLPVFFVGCVIGDSLSRLLQRPRQDATPEALDARLGLFFRACLR